MAGREPWIKLKVGTRRSGKLSTLPSDSARLGYIWLLLEAKVQRRLGVFDNRAHLLEVLGRFGRFLDAWIAAGLVHEAPGLCDDCKPRNAGVKRGQLVVHDYAKEQRDPSNADRQADYRANHRTDDDVPPEPPEEPDDEAPRNGDRNALRNADRNGKGNGDRDATVTPDSRARGTTVTVTTTERISSGENPGARERADVQALLDRGWPKVTRAQRKVLDELLTRHDMTGPAFAAEVIRLTPPDRDPLAAVMDADRLWQDAQRAKTEADEAAWASAKAGERDGADERIAWLQDQVASR